MASTLVIKRMDPVTKTRKKISPFIRSFRCDSQNATGYVLNYLFLKYYMKPTYIQLYFSLNFSLKFNSEQLLILICKICLRLINFISDKPRWSSKIWWDSKSSWGYWSLYFQWSTSRSRLEIFPFSYQSSCRVQGRQADSVFSWFISRTYSSIFKSQIWQNSHRRHTTAWSKGHKPLRIFCYDVGTQTSTQKSCKRREISGVWLREFRNRWISGTKGSSKWKKIRARSGGDDRMRLPSGTLSHVQNNFL